MIFFLRIPSGIVAAILGLFLIPQQREYRGIPVDSPGLLALATFLVPLILGISWARRDDAEPSTLLLLGLATVAAGFRDSSFVGSIPLLVHVGMPPQQIVVVGGEDDDGVVAELPYLTYLANNSHLMPNYGERYRNGAALATGFVESTVNQVVSQRCCTTQQLPWSTRGAPRLRPTCVKPRNGVCAPSSPIAPCLPSRGGFCSDVLSQIAGPRALQTLGLLLPQGPLAVI